MSKIKNMWFNKYLKLLIKLRSYWDLNPDCQIQSLEC